MCAERGDAHGGAHMNKTKLIADLCEIIRLQDRIIEDQAMELAQHDALNRADQIAAVRQKFEDAMGAPIREAAET